ncbi:hypothetical protein [Pseudodesulfovibrio tunisiensis]|uniref:hypothetical protein n=1 Tax=Pseudodesulfovibrio tunisiensis TaxID=463192 RepID=UPI001FB4712B|nr:hypothetical protein [Pseudodesulfovibrio tunisiensis]
MTDHELQQLVEQSASTDMAFLLKAKEDAKARMKADPSKANIAAFNKAAEALDRLVRNGRDAAGRTGSGRTFDSVEAVRRFLSESGFAAARTTVSRHHGKGLFGRNSDGVFEETAVLAYAEAHLKLSGSGKKVSEEDKERSRRKSEAEIALLEEKHLREQLKRRREQGRLVERNELELYVAARAGVLESMIKSEFQKRILEYVELVGGRPGRAKDLLQELNHTLDAALNEYARTDSFEVVFRHDDA